MESGDLTPQQVEFLLRAKWEEIAWNPLLVVFALELRRLCRWPADPEAFAAFDPSI